MQDILVIRFGALGDLCLLGWTLSGLAAAPDRTERRVTLVTKARFADLAGRFEGVDRVVSLAEPGRLADLVRMVRELRPVAWNPVLDAHGVIRSRLVTSMLGGRPRARLRKDTAARLKLLRGGGATPGLQRHMRDRLDAVIARAGSRLGEATPPLAGLAGQIERTAIGLAPGAQWDTKRWPDRHWAELVRRIRAESDTTIRVFLGPREEAWWDGSPLADALAGDPHTELVRGRSLVDVASLLAGCRRLVCNDSGLMHLAEAVGTPVAAFFGPTVRAFGYAPQLPPSVLLEEPELECRPCSRNGKRPCHRGDLACLERIAPMRAWPTLVADLDSKEPRT